MDLKFILCLHNAHVSFFKSESYENNFICSGLFFWFQNTPYICNYLTWVLSKLHINLKTENEKIMILWIRAQKFFFWKKISFVWMDIILGASVTSAEIIIVCAACSQLFSLQWGVSGSSDPRLRCWVKEGKDLYSWKGFRFGNCFRKSFISVWLC